MALLALSVRSRSIPSQDTSLRNLPLHAQAPICSTFDETVEVFLACVVSVWAIILLVVNDDSTIWSLPQTLPIWASLMCCKCQLIHGPWMCHVGVMAHSNHAMWTYGPRQYMGFPPSNPLMPINNPLTNKMNGLIKYLGGRRVGVNKGYERMHLSFLNWLFVCLWFQR